MKEEYIIKGSDLEKVFRNLKVTKELMNLSEKDEDKSFYERCLSEFVGIYCSFITLGLEEDWQQWQVSHSEYD